MLLQTAAHAQHARVLILGEATCDRAYLRYVPCVTTHPHLTVEDTTTPTTPTTAPTNTVGELLVIARQQEESVVERERNVETHEDGRRKVGERNARGARAATTRPVSVGAEPEASRQLVKHTESMRT